MEAEGRTNAVRIHFQGHGGAAPSPFVALCLINMAVRKGFLDYEQET